MLADLPGNTGVSKTHFQGRCSGTEFACACENGGASEGAGGFAGEPVLLLLYRGVCLSVRVPLQDAVRLRRLHVESVDGAAQRALLGNARQAVLRVPASAKSASAHLHPSVLDS